MTFPVPSAPRKRQPAASALPAVEEVSAGGVIVDLAAPSHPVAIIARLNRGGRLEWCLPKGHPEGAETNPQAAVREIAEETGILGRVICALGSIDYWFAVEGQKIHKTVHHYLLEATSGTLSADNDPDHEAVDVAWVDIDDLGRTLSFPNERRIADIAREYIIHQL